MDLRIIILIILFGISTSISGQIVFNEVLSSNVNGITDEDQEYSDWLELYNFSDTKVNLEGYILDDNLSDSLRWAFPSFEMEAQSFLLIFASGKDRKVHFAKSKTIIKKGDEWKYKVPGNILPETNWRNTGFNDSDWLEGKSGFGYGDDDDETEIRPLQSIFIRKKFTIENLSALQSLILHVDYDDAFIAFINGEPVVIENVNVFDDDYYNVEVPVDHEAVMHTNGTPTKFEIDVSSLSLIEGENVLAIQGYNVGENSSDFSLIPFLTLKSTSYTVNEVADFLSLSGDGFFHTDFKIDKDGESLYLFSPELEIVDSVNVVELPSNVSYGRFVDGTNNWFYFPVPTPGEANLDPIDELRIDTVLFSIPAGFYSQTQLSLSSNASDVIIRFTNDGTEPDLNSQSYTEPIIIQETQVIKATPFTGNVKSGETITKTYFIDTNHELPVIELSTNPKHFFDWDEGILVEGPNAQQYNEHPGANYWMGWEKVVHFEYFDENGDLQIDQDAGCKVAGGWSRVNAQKSMALYARSKYGKGSFKYKFFKDRETEKFESILLRNSGNDWPQTMLRDGFVSEVVKDLDVDRLAFQPTVVYLNGEYWGILNMREKPNEHYFESNHGVKEEELNLLETNGVAVNGSVDEYYKLINFVSGRSLLSEDNYADAASKINVDCFINYELIQLYINNRDWPGNNIKFWNTSSASSKFRWLLYDTDFGFGLYGPSEYMQDGISFATQASGPSWPNPPWSTLLLRRMLSNENFKHQFINRMADLINTNFDPDNMYDKLDSVSSLIDSEIINHKNMWGGSYSEWMELLDVINNFNDNRAMYVQDHFLDYFDLNKTCKLILSVSDEEKGQIKVNTIVPLEYPFSGKYLSDIPITFKALPKPGYKFVRWEQDLDSDKAKIEIVLSGTTNLHAVFEKDNSNEFDVLINEINYQSGDDDESGDWIEIYNNGSKTIDLNAWKLSDDANDKLYTFSEGNFLYPDDYFVMCKDLDKFKIIHPDVENVCGDFKFGLSSKGDFIKLMDSENNIIDQVLYETKLPWPIEPLSTSATLELINPYIDNNVYSNWEAGPEGGTPGRKNGIQTSLRNINRYNHQITCFPTHFSDYTTLRFYSRGKGTYLIQIVDIQGRILNSINGEFNSDGTHYLDIFTESGAYKKGLYLVKVKTETGTETIRVIKH